MSGDNQQVTGKGWLCGLLDTDGTIGLRLGHSEFRTPYVMVTNTREEIIERASHVLHAMGIGNHVSWHPNGSNRANLRGEVLVGGLKRVGALLPQLSLVAKEPRANLLEAYIHHRKALPKNSHYTQRDDEFWKELRNHPSQEPQRLHAILSEKDDDFLTEWLAGVVDGDGALMIRSGSTGPDGKKRLNIDLVVVNTDPMLIEAAHTVIQRLGSNATKVKKNNGAKATKPVYHLQTAGYKRTVPVLNAILPHLVGKQQQAKLLLELWRYRQTLPFYTPYGDFENEIKRQVQALNHRGTRDEDIVRAA